MTSGERVETLKRLATRLSNEGTWVHIDLVLAEFGFMTSHQRSDDEYSYCLEMLQSGTVDDLLRLEAYYFGHDPGPDEIELIWRSGQFRLFVSHIALHKVEAKALSESLSDFGVHGFVAHEDIKPNKEWQQAILNCLRTCEALVALLRPGFHNSNWTDQEVGYVFGRSRPVLSVRQGIDPYGFIGAFQGIAGGEKDAPTLAREIVDVLLADPRTADTMREALVARLVTSTSFATSNRMVTVLRTCSISPEQYQRLRTAQVENGQVGDAFSVASYLDGIGPPTTPPIRGEEEPF